MMEEAGAKSNLDLAVEQVQAREKVEDSVLQNSILAAIVHSSEDAIVSKTLEGIVTSWNPGAQKLFGFTVSEMIGQPITKLIPDDRLDEEPQILRKIQSGETVNHFETKRRTKSGGLVDISLTISPIKNEEGTIIGASKIARDISERKKLEANLAFLAEISRDLVQISDWREMISVIGEKIGTFLNVAICTFAEIDEEAGYVLVTQDWHRSDTISMVGTHRIADYAKDEAMALLKANEIYIVTDTNDDPKVDKENAAKLGLASAITIPYLKEGVLTNSLTICDSAPRNWSKDEIEFMRELATRIWIRLEKAKVEESLKKSEEKYRTLFNSLDGGFCIIEVLFDEHGEVYDYRFLETNNAFDKQTGLVNVIGKTMKELNPNHEQYWFDTYGRIAKTGKAERFENAADALGHYYEVYAFPTDATKPHQVAILFNDISERKRQETSITLLAEVGKELEHFSSIQEKETLERIGAKIAQHFKVSRCSFAEVNEEKDEVFIICDWHVEGLPTIAREQAYHTYDFVSDELHSDIRSGKIVAVSDTAEHPGTDYKAFEQLNIRSFITSSFVEEGKWNFSIIIADMQPRSWRNDEIELMQELADRIWDFLERKQQEEKYLLQLERDVKERTSEISKQKEFIETIINATPDLVTAYDLEFRIIAFNKACEDFFNMKSSEVLGRAFTEIFPAAKGGQGERDLLRAFRGETIHNAIYHSPVTGQYYENYISPLKDDAGEIYAAIAIAHNITDRINAERKIEEKNHELQKINKELEAFTYISSHDLQEPLRKIQAFADRILEKEEHHFSESTKHYFNRITDAATRMQALIQDLLNFSRLTTTEKKFELIDLNIIVEDVKAQLKEVIEAKGATLETGDLCQVSIIPFQFRQLLYNLISNALKFSRPNIPPHITIKSEMVSAENSPLGGNKACHITVSDNGIGFEASFSEKIFEVFQKLHSKDQYEGTGIGLAIVKKIVEHHNGLITASSELNEGATFDIYIPA